MGGNLVINYLLRRENGHIAGAIATSPFLELAFNPPKWKLTASKILRNIAPSATFDNGLEVNAISRIPEEVEKYKNDPLVHRRISPNYSIAIIDAGAWALNNSSNLEKPLLVLHGTGDMITSYKASEKFVKDTNATLKLFQGGYHELHHDLCGNEAVKTIINWIKKQNSPTT